MQDTHKIASADVGKMPASMFDAMPTVTAVMDDGTSVTLFSYYPDEITFRASEFVGLTVAQAHELRTRRDVAYLRS